jgi:hypothetical protein
VPAVLLNWRFFQPRDFHGELPTLFVLPATRCCASVWHLLSVDDVWQDLKHSFSASYSAYATTRHETAADQAANLQHVDVSSARERGSGSDSAATEMASSGVQAAKSQAVLDALEADRLDVEMDVEAIDDTQNETDPELAQAWNERLTAQRTSALQVKLIGPTEVVDWSDWQMQPSDHAGQHGETPPPMC